MPDALIDGRAASSIPIDDRGLLYGDHLFETIAFHGDSAPLWPHHMARLQRDGARLGIPVPAPGLLLGDCLRLLAGVARAVVRITITRGSGGRAYQPPDRPVARRIVQRRAWPQGLARQRRDGLRVVTSPIPLARNPALAGIKHGNRLEQVLAARACAAEGADEALLFTADGSLIEAIASNVVVVAGQHMLTPDCSVAGVAGVGLAWLRAQPAVDIVSASLGRDELAAADEILMVNSVAGIRPVSRLDDRRLKTGPAARHLQHLWHEQLECIE